jgi:hypothetical protein
MNQKECQEDTKQHKTKCLEQSIAASYITLPAIDWPAILAMVQN